MESAILALRLVLLFILEEIERGEKRERERTVDGPEWSWPGLNPKEGYGVGNYFYFSSPGIWSWLKILEKDLYFSWIMKWAPGPMCQSPKESQTVLGSTADGQIAS